MCDPLALPRATMLSVACSAQSRTHVRSTQNWAFCGEPASCVAACLRSSAGLACDWLSAKSACGRVSFHRPAQGQLCNHR
ncbi:hypothetical protein BDQ12DRAFT_388903 [Crucibulum laeve]|uniref:Uncharacterized protein n=1 Tax=Crucibulum laeve TaxID=68775 RepID=A0A5C3MA78_9AGAR|nr:hypothetical protein BDQ12DRAFT_388903 [Crucibulum laeve]